MHDLLPTSSEHFFIVIFSKTSSPVYDEAVEVARLATVYREANDGRKARHCAVFDESPEKVLLAMRLTQLARDWKGTMFFARGRLIAPYGGWSALEVLTCLSTAQRCTDWKAHCLSVIDGLEAIESLEFRQLPSSDPNRSNGRYLFPCARLRMYFTLDRGPVSSLTDRVQAKAVAQNVDWCPRFDIGNFRPFDGEISI
jgi:hypothetical protein